MRKALAALVIGLVALSACAGQTGSSDDPKATLVEGLRRLLVADSLTQTISIESDVDSLVAVSKGKISKDVASKLLGSSLTLAGTQAEDPADTKSLVLVNLAGSDALEMRFVDGDLFVRADVADLLETFGEDPAQLDAMAAQVQGQKGFEWVEGALAGEWVVMRDAADLAQSLGGTGATVSAEQQKKIIDDLLNTVEQNARVTSHGEEETGEHLTASLPIRETVQDLLRFAPTATPPGMQRSLDELPEGDLKIDFWVADGAVTQLSFDVTQFESMTEASGEDFPEGVDRLAIIVRLGEFEGNVEPVDDAVEIDGAALMQTLSGLATGMLPSGGATDGGTGAAFDCSMLKGAPPEVVELYAKECPELQK